RPQCAEDRRQQQQYDERARVGAGEGHQAANEDEQGERHAQNQGQNGQQRQGAIDLRRLQGGCVRQSGQRGGPRGAFRPARRGGRLVRARRCYRHAENPPSEERKGNNEGSTARTHADIIRPTQRVAFSFSLLPLTARKGSGLPLFHGKAASFGRRSRALEALNRRWIPASRTRRSSWRGG